MTRSCKGPIVVWNVAEVERTSTPATYIVCNIAHNNYKGRHIVQFSHCTQYCLQCCIVCPVLKLGLPVVKCHINCWHITLLMNQLVHYHGSDWLHKPCKSPLNHWATTDHLQSKLLEWPLCYLHIVISRACGTAWPKYWQQISLIKTRRLPSNMAPFMKFDCCISTTCTRDVDTSHWCINRKLKRVKMKGYRVYLWGSHVCRQSNQALPQQAWLPTQQPGLFLLRVLFE